MSQFSTGDIVSFNRAQVSTVDVLTTPVGPEAYTVNLPINGVPKAFTFDAVGGETVNQIVDALLAILLDQQTHYSVALDGFQLVIVGPLGEAFTPTVTANLTTTVATTAVQVINRETGRPWGRIRVVRAESDVHVLRDFTTRDKDGNLLPRNTILGRELDGGLGIPFDFDSSRILTTLETAP